MVYLPTHTNKIYKNWAHIAHANENIEIKVQCNIQYAII